MPLQRYGVLTGRVIDRRAARGGPSPHHQIHGLARDRDHHRVTINVRSQRTPSALLYLLDTDFHHANLELLARLPEGLVGLPSTHAGWRSTTCAAARERVRATTAQLLGAAPEETRSWRSPLSRVKRFRNPKTSAAAARPPVSQAMDATGMRGGGAAHPGLAALVSLVTACSSGGTRAAPLHAGLARRPRAGRSS